MIIEYLGKEARKKFKKEVTLISKDIKVITKNITGYIEPKNCELVFNQSNLPDKLKTIQAIKEYLPKFNAWRFDRQLSRSKRGGEMARLKYIQSNRRESGTNI